MRFSYWLCSICDGLSSTLLKLWDDARNLLHSFKANPNSLSRLTLKLSTTNKYCIVFARFSKFEFLPQPFSQNSISALCPVCVRPLLDIHYWQPTIVLRWEIRATRFSLFLQQSLLLERVEPRSSDYERRRWHDVYTAFILDQILLGEAPSTSWSSSTARCCKVAFAALEFVYIDKKRAYRSSTVSLDLFILDHAHTFDRS